MDFSVKPNASLKFGVKYWQPGKVAPIDLSAYNIYMDIKRSEDDDGFIYRATAANNSLIIDAVNGTIKVSVPPSTLAKIKHPRPYFQVVISSSTEYDVLLDGYIKL